MPCQSTPKLLWRCANDNSQGINHRNGYVAYIFTDRLGSIPSPEEYTRDTFRAMVENHVRMHQIPSPFISTSVDPLVAIHRALRQEDHAIISLVDTTQLDQSLIFSMHELMNQYDIKIRGYTGRKEYPIWGAISKSALVMTFRIDELLKIAEQNTDIKAVLKPDLIADSPRYWTHLTKGLAQGNSETGPGAGRAIGKLLRLLDLPPDYVDDAAALLNQSWKFVPEDIRTNSSVVSGRDLTKHRRQTRIKKSRRHTEIREAVEQSSYVFALIYGDILSPSRRQLLHGLTPIMKIPFPSMP
jgi:hypothetical protein